MSEANEATVKTIYEAFGTGDVPTILDKLTDDVDWAADTASTVAPWFGQRVGKDAVADFFQAIGGAVEVTAFTPLSFASNETDVFAFLDFGVTVRATGKSGTMHLHHYFRFRDGKIEYYRGTEDTALTEELFRA
jgi:ketosteroid isomerase-like protein